MIEFKSVDFGFAGQPLFAGFNLDIAAGRTTALMGSSGSGKSTLLRLILGLIWPDAGEIRFDGAPLSADRLADIRQRTGYLTQGGGLFPHLTAADNVTLMARRLSWSRSQLDSRLAELVRLTRLEPELLARMPAELSGGQRQRVALMRALMLDPDWLLLDEPFSALDPLIRHQLQDELKALIAELNKTVVLVTHDVAEAAWLADHLVLLSHGEIVQQGTFEAFRQQPATPFVEQFLAASRELPR